MGKLRDIYDRFIDERVPIILLILSLTALAGTYCILKVSCPYEGCTPIDLLQVWVEFWGFAIAIFAAFTAWIEATRKPNLKLRLHEEVTAPIIFNREKHREKFVLYVENISREPARYPKIVIELQYPQTILEYWEWENNFGVVDFSGLGDFLGAPQVLDDSNRIMGTRDNQKTTMLFELVGGENIILYGKEPAKPILECEVGSSGLITQEKLKKLADPGITEFSYNLKFHLYSDNGSPVSLEIPLIYRPPIEHN